MIQNIPKRLFRRYIQKYFIPNIKLSYSQFGEDIIMTHLFYQLDIDKPTYLDIGANEPRFISNTFYFYEHGSRGICIEPNPVLCKKIKKIRPGDEVINAGVGINNEDEADFFLFPDYANGLSTFSEKEALHWQAVGMKGLGKIQFEKKIKVKLIDINTILEKYCKTIPDILSIDVEGLDLQILQSLDFTKYKPKVVCAETFLYDENSKGYKDHSIENLLQKNGYTLYADTRINSIFCLTELL